MYFFSLRQNGVTVVHWRPQIILNRWWDDFHAYPLFSLCQTFGTVYIYLVHCQFLTVLNPFFAPFLVALCTGVNFIPYCTYWVSLPGWKQSQTEENWLFKMFIICNYHHQDKWRDFSSSVKNIKADLPMCFLQGVIEQLVELSHMPLLMCSESLCSKFKVFCGICICFK